MNNPDLDNLAPLPLPVRLAIGFLGVSVAVLGLAHGWVKAAEYHARPRR